jgi:hypothetical protein
MKCEDFKKSFYEFHDEMLDPIHTLEMEKHIKECEECSRINVRYKKFLGEFSNLPDSIEPEKDLWDGIKKSISDNNIRHINRFRIGRIRFLSIAASFAVMILFSAIMVLYGRNNDADAKTLKQFDAASKEYVKAREELMTALHSKEGVLIHETIEVIENNLIIMDQAIGEIKLAIRKEPRNQSLVLMLADTYHKETDLLLSTRDLIMHLGNEE